VLLDSRAGSPLPPSEDWRLTSGAHGVTRPYLPKIIPADPPDLAQLALLTTFYDEQDVAHRIIYVERRVGARSRASFVCRRRDVPVRQAAAACFSRRDAEAARPRRGASFKFVDRTFNLDVNASRAILEFFLARHQPGNFLSLRDDSRPLPAELREVIAKFPPGALQFEVGIQTFNDEVAARISAAAELRTAGGQFPIPARPHRRPYSRGF